MAALPRTGPARASALVVSRPVDPGQRPAIAFEHALVIWSGATRRQHLVLQLAPRCGNEPFVLLVPTPSRPEIARVAGNPFPALRDRLPFHGPTGTVDPDARSGHGFGGRRRREVDVVERVPIAPFLGSAVASDDLRALRDQHRSVGGGEVDAWLGHLAERGFHLASLRFAAAPDAKGPAPCVRTETVRITFETPAPFFPYREPHPGGPRRDEPRMSELWVVTDTERSPVASRQVGGEVGWARPFVEGHRHLDVARAELDAALGGEASLLPPGPLHVQRFVDQKRSREGWGDVVFVPRSSLALPVSDPILERLLTVLDPSLPTVRDR